MENLKTEIEGSRVPEQFPQKIPNTKWLWCSLNYTILLLKKHTSHDTEVPQKLRKRYNKKKNDLKKKNKSGTSTREFQKAERALDDYKFLSWLDNFIYVRESRTNVVQTVVDDEEETFITQYSNDEDVDDEEDEGEREEREEDSKESDIESTQILDHSLKDRSVITSPGEPKKPNKVSELQLARNK